MRSLRFVGLALALAAAGGCSVLGPDDFEEESERLAAARARWADHALVDYSYVLRPLCFCGITKEARVTVEDGERTGVIWIEDDEPVPEAFTSLYKTVPELFDLIEDAIDRRAHSIEVRYDPTLGYPTYIRVDYEEFTADEEMGFDASSLTPLT